MLFLKLAGVGVGVGAGLLTWIENDSPWNETDKLLVAVKSILCAAGALPPLAVVGLVVPCRRRSTDCDRFAAVTVVAEEFIVLVTIGELHRFGVDDTEEDENDVVEEEHEEEDK